MFDPWLVLDSIEDVIDGYSEWDWVELHFIFFTGFDNASGRL